MTNWIYLKFLVLILIGTGHLISAQDFVDDDDPGFRRSDLFLQGRYFLGMPSSIANPFSDLVTFTGMDVPDRLIDVAVGKPGNNADAETDDDNDFTWPGHESDSKIKNQGYDIIQAYKTNFARRRKTLTNPSLPLPAEVNSKLEECTKDMQACGRIKSLNNKDMCHIQCVLKNDTALAEATNVIHTSVKTLCQSTDTIFTKLFKLKIKSADAFKKVLKKVMLPLVLLRKASVQGVLTNLIRQVVSSLSPYRPLLDLFENELKPVDSALGLKGRVLIDRHPGCSMVELTKPINKAIELVSKDKTLADYLLFQGFALFSSITKYVPDFKSKNEFAGVNNCLNMMVGTTCGLYNFGLTGEKSDCDQYGAFPVTNFPIPRSLWTGKLQSACEIVRKQILRSKETGRTDGDDAPPEESRRRRRRALAVGV